MTIDKDNPNHIFVFGSNTEGRHGKGAALYARKNHGAIYGQSTGLQGNSYAVVTKNLNPNLGIPFGRRSIDIDFIEEDLFYLWQFAKSNSHLTFFLSRIGTGNAGYTFDEMYNIISKFNWPENVDLSEWNPIQ